MHPEVEAFKREWEEGDRTQAKRLAKQYVQGHREELAPTLEQYTREELVDLVSEYRKAGREEERIIADMWLLSEYDPQQISGVVNKVLDPDELLRVLRGRANG